MNRRDALKNVALFMGATVIGGSAFLAGCQKNREEELEDEGMFTRKEIGFMDEFGETIIPATDTPGAKAAGVGSFMAIMVRDCYDAKHQRTFLDGLETLKTNFYQEYGKEFVKANNDERSSFVNNLENEMVTYYQQKNYEDPEHIYKMLKELTLLGYFTSEIGATQALKYSQTPGYYEACIPYEKGGKAWA